MDSRAPQPRHDTAPPGVFAGMVRVALMLAMVALPVIVVVAWIWRDEDGALGALVGWLIAVVFFTVGLFALKVVMAGPAGPTMAGAFVVYLGQLILLVGAVLVLRRETWYDGRALAGSAIATTVVWQIGQILGYVRARQLAFPDADPSAGGTS
ncbi:hypothetical protein [Luteipulveratus halotolerans]|uniref:ATP synthase protein I n=1 Tax=Luteipulveratus halotolerans TaxID=1631356 RepID=A0A0L6CGH0_9MICO|nr:hypothetical protein [Luteipulveratus halotolerans]KNX36618.1 hypothetical protein VV01_04755 [Luteipulveratus halotolerans]